MTSFLKSEDCGGSDKVVREMDVFLNEALELYLVQFPLKPVFSEYPDVKSARMRPKHCKVEMDIIADTNSRLKTETTTMCSSKIEQQSCMGIGVIQNGALHITPVTTTVQMRPSFENLQTREVVQDLSSEDEDDAEPAAAIPLQQVHMRRKESDKAESSRVQSFSFLQSQEEAESWVALHVYEPDSTECQEVFSTLYYIDDADEV